MTENFLHHVLLIPTFQIRPCKRNIDAENTIETNDTLLAGQLSVMISVGRYILFTNLHNLIAFGGAWIPGSVVNSQTYFGEKRIYPLKRSGRRHLLNDVCKCGDC